MRSWAALLFLNLLLLLPFSLQVEFEPWLALGLCGDMALLAALLGWIRRPGLVAVLYSSLLIYELDRLVGSYLMGQDPLLFDQLLLLRHLVVLAQDLLGGWGLPALLGIVALLGLLHAGVWALFRLGQRAPRLVWAAAAAPIALLLAWPKGPWPARWVTPDLVEDVVESIEVWRSLDRELGALHPELQELELRSRPDVEIHVVESYGRMLDTELLRDGWVLVLDGIEHELTQAGWVMASGFSVAPVSGGRSWIADASFLLGMKIQHQSEYQHIVGQIDGLPHMPGWFAERGYSTIVMRPKDRVRPGIALRNDFDWEHTVFHAELGYEGQNWGWGGVPDQYALGWLRDELWPLVESPRLLFFHMVGSHAPWDDIPPLVEDWRTLSDGSAEAAEEKEFSWTRDAKRYKRKKRNKAGPVGKLSIRGEDYRDAVLRDLEVLTADLLQDRERPAVVILMGDHQPPLLSRTRDFQVPVHVLATEPELLEGFLDAGFQEGMVPSGDAVTRNEAIYPILVRSLSH